MALITNPGASSRKKETELMENELKKFPHLKLVRLSDLSPSATLDGGDVMVTEQNVFIGLSSRTNIDAINAASKIFSTPVHPISLPPGASTLHLKSFMSVMDGNTIVIYDRFYEHFKQELSKVKCNSNYNFVVVPDIVASNVLRINNNLFIQDGFAESEKILVEEATKRNLKVIKLQMSELIKADGALTCCSLFIPKNKHQWH